MTRTVATMPDCQSLLLILSRDAALEAQAARILAPYGWRLRSVSEVSRALSMLAKRAIAALLVDEAEYDLPALTAAVRALPAPANGTPILMPGPAPLDAAAFTALLERWAGPLGDHASRAPPFDARYRLIRLVGRDNAAAMLGRFHAALEEAIATAARDPGAVPAHRLAGLAGLIGEAELHRLWSRVDAGEPGALASAVEASQQALAATDPAVATARRPCPD